MLREVSLPIEQRDCDHGEAEVGGGADGVSREYPQAATIARHGVLERNLHGKVSDKAFN
jgi:hypothetical protein